MNVKFLQADVTKIAGRDYIYKFDADVGCRRRAISVSRTRVRVALLLLNQQLLQRTRCKICVLG